MRFEAERIVTCIRVSLLAAAIALSSAVPAQPQVPPHTPGTICLTPTYWCWAVAPGSPGAACGCPTPYGWEAGYLI